MPSDPLRVVFLLGNSGDAAVPCMQRICQLPDILPVGILVDTHRPGWRIRLRNLTRNVRREGLAYPIHRLGSAVRAWVERFAARVAPPGETDALLRKAFPDRCFTVHDVAARYRIPIHAAGNLNSTFAASTLQDLSADLAIVLGTRILRRSTFAVPRFGSINLHKGKVPEYRGMPPGFWEIFDGTSEAGVTVHFVDDGLDTGNIVATATIPVSPNETPESLQRKLDLASVDTLAEAVTRIQQGERTGTPQPKGISSARTRPTRRQRLELARRLGQKSRNDWVEAAKTAVYLGIYHSGLFTLIRKLRASHGVRASILLYHRVNDYAEDPLTVSTRRLAEHLVAMRPLYQPVSTAAIVRMLQQDVPVGPHAVAIHFDDCYEDVYTEGLPLLRAAGFPACFFISSGFLDTHRVFEHDRTRYAFRFPNLSTEQLVDWVRQGFELGAHTVNHVNLGVVTGSALEAEISESGATLRRITGEPVTMFSFPFGQPEHISVDARARIQEGGYQALFSAYGGFVSRSTDLYDIPRLGASGLQLPLRLLMDLEGLGFEDLKARIRNRFRRPRPST